MRNAIVTGSGAGLGRAIADELGNQGYSVYGYDRKDGRDVSEPDFDFIQKIRPVDVLVNCAGINKINWMEYVTAKEWDEVLDINAKALFFMTKACLPGLSAAKGTVLNIVSNAAHMPMTCSAAYNASKGAALILTKQMARELYPRHGITVFSISPNKLKGTEMSQDIEDQVVKTRGWDREYAEEYQRKSLPIQEETDPQQLAEFIGFILSTKERHKYFHGCDIPYGA